MKYIKSHSAFNGSKIEKVKKFEQFELDWSETDELFLSDLKNQDELEQDLEEKEESEDQGDVDSSGSEV